MTSSMSPAPAPAYAQVMEDMEKGKELAAQLQGLLRDSPEAGRFVDQILHTFSRAMRALDKAAVSAAGGEGSEVQSEVTCGGGASAGGKRKAPAADRKANCRRSLGVFEKGIEEIGKIRKTRTQQSSGNSVVVKNLDDGQAWRKYGQKEIQNSKHPKAYFRCTHKYDQLCTAQRQVQRCDDDPASYRVTYIGEHTCRDPATAPIIAAHVIHQVSAGDNDDGCGGLQAGSRLISFVAAPAAPVDAAAAPTTSTITTVTAPGPAAAAAQRLEGRRPLVRPGGGAEQPYARKFRGRAAAAAAAESRVPSGRTRAMSRPPCTGATTPSPAWSSSRTTRLSSIWTTLWV
ncbi:hypothetical protein OsJ_18062 [Oryza sativa Japonica Group]|uniref:WRKY domain-containing protein n=1 Tax=Oryza sativa subsp. japonica TaxID=39947 RepID=B9FNW2_ORYSJ|nr:hypothetical protein OsJ_18062 [Oryza sativa Japonica Group]